MVAIAFVLLLALASPASATGPVLAGGPELASDTGHVLLQWRSDEPVTLSISDGSGAGAARAVYSGERESYFLSGLADGEYYLSLRDASGEQSAPVKLVVSHQSLERALWLTLVGLIVTIAIVATIARGARDD